MINQAIPSARLTHSKERSEDPKFLAQKSQNDPKIRGYFPTPKPTDERVDGTTAGKMLTRHREIIVNIIKQ